jgi:hypothetical protein
LNQAALIEAVSKSSIKPERLKAVGNRLAEAAHAVHA